MSFNKFESAAMFTLRSKGIPGPEKISKSFKASWISSPRECLVLGQETLICKKMGALKLGNSLSSKAQYRRASSSLSSLVALMAIKESPKGFRRFCQIFWLNKYSAPGLLRPTEFKAIYLTGSTQIHLGFRSLG